MSANSKIEWTDHTFNPWIGCTKVSPGCANCYAETLMDARYGRVKWGKGNPRVRTKTWKEPMRWNRQLQQHNERHGDNQRSRVFCASLADWLDDEVPIEWLADLLKLIHQTPHLDWLLLTKRPQNFFPRMCKVSDLWESETEHRSLELFDWLENEWFSDQPPANIWVGTTVEDQQRADERIPHLLKIPAKIRFLSCEPLLGSVKIAKWLVTDLWVICGGESGASARPMNPDWARSLRDVCSMAGVPFFFKQWGEWVRNSDIHTGAEQSKVVPFGDGDPTNFRRMYRVGKARAGRLLDGREWNEFPNVV